MAFLDGIFGISLEMRDLRMRKLGRILTLMLIFVVGFTAVKPDAEAARRRRAQKTERIPIPTPRPARYAVLPEQGPIPGSRPDDGGETSGPASQVVRSTKGDRVFRTLPAQTGDGTDDRAGADDRAYPGADLPVPISTDLDEVNPETIAPGLKIPSVTKAFASALKDDPRFCRDDIRRLSQRSTATVKTEKYNLEDYIRAGVRAGASESQMRQTLAAYASNKSTIKNQRYLTVIDYSKRSNQKRMFILDMETNTVKTYHVAHGKGSDPSGRGRATKFGNKSGSKRTSLGCFIAGGTYHGGNGKSLILHGLEAGVNDNACARSVVMHGASYVGGTPGRSWGCPAVKNGDRNEVFRKVGGGGLICTFNGDNRG